LCPPGSTYLKQKEKITYRDFAYNRGILQALRADYENHRLQAFHEFLHAEMFGDFLELARHLLEEGYKDPAAVIAGGVLEQHLRKLCAKYGVSLSERPKLDSMNSELVKKGVYTKTEQKQVTAWAGLRHHAAHAEWDKYKAEQVDLMIQGVRHFIN